MVAPSKVDVQRISSGDEKGNDTKKEEPRARALNEDATESP